jgi:hypothetical protein
MSRKTGRPSYLQPGPAADQRRRRTLIVAVVLVGLVTGLVGAGVGYAVGRPGRTEAAVAELRRADAARDVTQIGELTTLARQTRDQLSGVLTEVQAASAAGRPVAGDRVAAWQQTMRQATDRFANPPSGTTATNVARGGLRAAVTAAAVAVDTYAVAARLEPAERKPLMEAVARQCTLAATTWSVAATQLDQINIDAGYGHQHVYLETGHGTGAFTSDGAPEGQPHAD